jgi:hypothetical protein
MGEVFQALEEGIVFIEGFLEDAPLELEQTELSINI